MSITESLSERAKYTYMLHLCREQIRVVGEGDMLALERIMLAKKAIIDSLVDAQGLMARDPSVITVINQIKAAELESQSILQNRLNRVREKLDTVSRFKNAKNAYRRYPAPRQNAGFVVDKYTPRYFDRAG